MLFYLLYINNQNGGINKKPTTLVIGFRCSDKKIYSLDFLSPVPAGIKRPNITFSFNPFK